MNGCNSITEINPNSCSAFSLIYPARQDTLETKRQILNHNVVYETVCSNKEKRTNE